MPLQIHHEDLIKNFADKTGLSRDQAKKLFGKEITGYSKRSITSESKLTDVVRGALARAEELGVEIDKGGKSGYGLRASVEKHIKTGSSPKNSTTAASQPGGLWSSVKSAFGTAPKRAEVKTVQKGPTKPQRLALGASGFEDFGMPQKGPQNEPRAPDIG